VLAISGLEAMAEACSLIARQLHDELDNLHLLLLRGQQNAHRKVSYLDRTCTVFQQEACLLIEIHPGSCSLVGSPHGAEDESIL
jgi:hypothetical protein